MPTRIHSVILWLWIHLDCICILEFRGGEERPPYPWSGLRVASNCALQRAWHAFPMFGGRKIKDSSLSPTQEIQAQEPSCWPALLEEWRTEVAVEQGQAGCLGVSGARNAAVSHGPMKDSAQKRGNQLRDFLGSLDASEESFQGCLKIINIPPFRRWV